METEPNMSKILPIGLRFSSTTVSPILGIISILITIFRLGLMWRTRPSLCKLLITLTKSRMVQRASLFKPFYRDMCDRSFLIQQAPSFSFVRAFIFGYRALQAHLLQVCGPSSLSRRSSFSNSGLNPVLCLVRRL